MSEKNDKTAYSPLDAYSATDALKSGLEEGTEPEQFANSGNSSISVNDLEKRVCYFSLGGDQALKAFQKYHLDGSSSQDQHEELKLMVLQRLYFAIIMFDIVIFHCSDPLRSELIYEILSEHVDWIESGRIRFIANNDINDWQADYTTYITRKYKAYQTGFFAKLEADSLRQPHITQAYTQKVIDLLGKSKYFVRKDATNSSQFTSLLKDDIKHNNEQIVIGLDCEEDNLFSHVKQFAIEKTIYQLAHAQYYGTSTQNTIENVFDPQMISSIFRNMRNALDKGRAVARPAIVEAIKNELHEPTELQESIFDAITLRMDLLYCRMNAGKHLILESHPSYEEHTLYQLKCFNLYLKKFGYKHSSVEQLTAQQISRLASSREISDFRRIFLASMADTHEQNNFTMKIWSITTVFNDRCKRLLPEDFEKHFSEISSILGKS